MFAVMNSFALSDPALFFLLFLIPRTSPHKIDINQDRAPIACSYQWDLSVEVQEMENIPWFDSLQISCHDGAVQKPIHVVNVATVVQSMTVTSSNAGDVKKNIVCSKHARYGLKTHLLGPPSISVTVERRNWEKVSTFASACSSQV